MGRVTKPAKFLNTVEGRSVAAAAVTWLVSVIICVAALSQNKWSWDALAGWEVMLCVTLLNGVGVFLTADKFTRAEKPLKQVLVTVTVLVLCVVTLTLYGWVVFSAA